MARLVLVDSCVFIGLAHRGIHPLNELTARADTIDWATCGMVRVEVVRGVKVPRLKNEFSQFFDVLINAPSSNSIWESAAETAWMLDRRGITLPATDILIACCAQSIGAAVLSFDKHFLKIPDLAVFSSLEEIN